MRSDAIALAWRSPPNHALYADAPGRHGLCIVHRKGRASPRRTGKRER